MKVVPQNPLGYIGIKILIQLMRNPGKGEINALSGLKYVKNKKNIANRITRSKFSCKT